MTSIIGSAPRRTVKILHASEAVEKSAWEALDGLIEGQEVTSVVLHVFSVRMDGKLGAKLRNSGRLPLVGTTMSPYSASMEGVSLFSTARSVGIIRRNQSVDVSQNWSVKGVWEVLEQLFKILISGTASVHQEARIKALGFSKLSSQDLEVPVRSLAVSWD